MKKDYMTRLERAARWRLPRQEAEEVIADYRDFFGTPPRPEEELYRDVGDPEQVVKLLMSPPRAYRIWQAAFALMAGCILALGVSPTVIGYPIWNVCFYYNHLGPIFAALGAVLALAWFRWQGSKKGPIPKAVLILLGVLAAWTAGILLLNWIAMRDPVGFSAALGEVPAFIGPRDRMVSLSIVILNFVLEYGAVAMALVGTFGLVRARTDDRRWAAVYVLAMAAMLVSLEALRLFTSMDPSSGFSEGWYHAYLGQYAVIAALGLAGAGVALC